MPVETVRVGKPKSKASDGTSLPDLNNVQGDVYYMFPKARQGGPIDIMISQSWQIQRATTTRNTCTDASPKNIELLNWPKPLSSI